jgi:AcrR family transcriptional regulator
MKKQKDKRTLILDAMEKLIRKDRGAYCSVSEIAITAGIGKGSVYNYFDSKEDILAALILRTYSGFIENCKSILSVKANALAKMKLLYEAYYTQASDTAIEMYTRFPHKTRKKIKDPSMLAAYMRLPQNADLHLKTLAHIISGLTPIMSKIIADGNKEGTFKCKAPDEYSQIMLTVFAFLFDIYIFKDVKQDYAAKLKAFAEIMEKSLGAKKGGFAFMYKSPLASVK